MKIAPFPALRPPPEFAARVAAVPYDTVDEAEARALTAGNPFSFLRVEKSEIEAPAGAAEAAAHERAAANLAWLQAQGALRREAAAALYVYRQQSGAHVQSGLTACCAVADYEQGVIRKHEQTREDKERDRTGHIRRLNAHTGPVLLAYRGQPTIDRLAAEAAAGAPLLDFTADDGVRHTVWRCPDPAPFVAAFAAVPAAYIADGHHRAAAAANLARERRARGGGAGEAEWFLGVLFPTAQLRVLPIHRCVRDLNGLKPAAFLERVRRVFAVAPAARPEPPGRGHASLYLAGAWYDLSWAEPSAADPVARLDVSVLQDRLLAPLLGIRDPRRDPRLEFVGGSRGVAALAARVDSDQAAAALALAPITVEEIMAIADRGGILPPKSTWFDPKLRSGLFVHTFDA